jgi:hypothetical protein
MCCVYLCQCYDFKEQEQSLEEQEEEQRKKKKKKKRIFVRSEFSLKPCESQYLKLHTVHNIPCNMKKGNHFLLSSLILPLHFSEFKLNQQKPC